MLRDGGIRVDGRTEALGREQVGRSLEIGFEATMRSMTVAVSTRTIAGFVAGGSLGKGGLALKNDNCKYDRWRFAYPSASGIAAEDPRKNVPFITERSMPGPVMWYTASR